MDFLRPEKRSIKFKLFKTLDLLQKRPRNFNNIDVKKKRKKSSLKPKNRKNVVSTTTTNISNDYRIDR